MSMPGAESEAYRPLSMLAIAGLALGIVYGVLVSLGGITAFASRTPVLFRAGIVLVPLLGALGAWMARGRRPLLIVAAAVLALVGFLAVPIGIGGLMAFANQAPWLLPTWTVLIPVTGVVLSWLARSRIRASEGTLSGADLATWGLGLSLFYGLTYGAYVTSTSLAVTHQAGAFAQEWLEEVKAGRLENAFKLSLKPEDRMGQPSDKTELRSILEVRYNAPTSGRSASGLFSMFCGRDYVHFLQGAGPDAHVQPLGVVTWEYENDGYKVVLKYRVTTPQASFFLMVPVFGHESRTKEFKGRQWHVMLDQTGVARDTFPNMTEEGQTLMEQSMVAKAFAVAWLGKVTARDWDGAYLDTLPASERKGQEKARQKWHSLSVATGVAALASPDADVRAYLRQRDAFLDGQMIRSDPETFWATGRFRKEILDEIKTMFRPAASHGIMLNLNPSAVPVWKGEGAQRRYVFDIQMMIPNPNGVPNYMLEGQIVTVPDGAGSWRIEALELLRGNKAPMAQGPPGGRR
jgi:hypothetical protein